MNKYLEKLAGIRIRPSRKGLLHKKLGVPEDKKLSEHLLEQALHSRDPEERKEANFAINARKWKHS
jgi:hypothetical protein